MSAETTHKLLYRSSPETLFCIVVWIIILLAPIYEVAYDYLTDNSVHLEWRWVLYSYLHFLPFLVIFLLGKLIYEPKLFFEGRYTSFCLLSFLTAFVIILASGFLLPRWMFRPRVFVEQRNEQRYEPQGRAQVADSLSLGEIVADSAIGQRADGQRLRPWPYPQGVDEQAMREYWKKHRFVRYLRGPFLPRLLMALLMMGSSLAVAVFFRAGQVKLMIKEQQAAHLQSELDYLKYQVNPHFFMNTLNNIHALVDIDSELAKQSIIELSHLMRYILYESNQPTVPVRRELNFVRHYLELMKIRCDESVTLTYNEPEASAKGLDGGIPPLLLISFIENAFKHGISFREPSFIDIRVAIEGQQLHFHCANSRFNSDSMPDQPGGVGLDNVQKRLELIYPGRYTLDITPSEKVFTVDLTLPLGKKVSPSDPQTHYSCSTA